MVPIALVRFPPDPVTWISATTHNKTIGETFSTTYFLTGSGKVQSYDKNGETGWHDETNQYDLIVETNLNTIADWEVRIYILHNGDVWRKLRGTQVWNWNGLGLPFEPGRVPWLDSTNANCVTNASYDRIFLRDGA